MLPLFFNSFEEIVIKSSKEAVISCLEINFVSDSFLSPELSFLYGGFETIASKVFSSKISSLGDLFDWEVSPLAPLSETPTLSKNVKKFTTF